MSLKAKQEEAIRLRKQIWAFEKAAGSIMYPSEKKTLRDLKRQWKKLDKEVRKIVEKQLKIPGLSS